MKGEKTEKKENNKHDISLVFRGVRQGPKAKVETILWVRSLQTEHQSQGTNVMGEIRLNSDHWRT